MPEEATMSQAGETVREFLRANPEKRHARGESIFLAALSERWPCENGPALLLDNGDLTLLAPPMETGAPLNQD